VIQTLADVVLVGLLCVAAWYDIRAHRVPNELTLAGLAAALALRAPLGVAALVTGLQGFAVALAVAALFYALGAVGGGDAKLLAMVGAFLGLGPLPGALAYIVLLGAGMAIVAMARRGLLLLLFINTVDLFRSKRLVAQSGGVRTLETQGASTIPYAVPIAAGTLMWWFGQGVKL
jgi:prepilin peptidase CpaA